MSTLSSMLPSSIVDEDQEKRGTKITFSIDEILKPSFGSSNTRSKVTSDVQPLDMRKERDSSKVVNAELVPEKMQTELASGISPPLSTQNEELSNSNLGSSRICSPVRDCSSSRDSNIREYDKFDQENKLPRKHGFSDRKDSFFTLDKLHFITSNSYYNNTLNYIYNFDVCALEKHLYHRFEPVSHFLNPYIAHQNLFTKQGCALRSPNLPSDLKDVITYNNCEEILKPTQPGRPFETNNNFKKKITSKRSNHTPVDKSNNAESSSSDQKVKISTPGGSTNISNDDRGICPGSQKSVSDGKQQDPFAWPAWVYCTRYSDRPSSGPRYRKPRSRSNSESDKRPRIAFSTQQLHRLRREFENCPYLSETRRQALAVELCLNESQVKIWFQNKRAKLKKSSGSKNLLALRLMEEGLYNHSTIVVDGDETKSGQHYEAVRR